MKAPRRSTSSADQRADARSAVMLGWLSGLGLLVAPWIGAGVLASLGSLTGRESWEPERTFPWLLLATGLVNAGWLVYASLRIPGFRRGAVPATAIAVVVIAAVGTAGVVLA